MTSVIIPDNINIFDFSSIVTYRNKYFQDVILSYFFAVKSGQAYTP